MLNSFTIESVPRTNPVNYFPNNDVQSDVSSTIYGFGSIDDDRTYIQDVNRSSYVSIYLRGTKPIEKCAICYDYLKSFQIIRTLNCEHYFHQKCADRWLERKIIVQYVGIVLWKMSRIKISNYMYNGCSYTIFNK